MGCSVCFKDVFNPNLNMLNQETVILNPSFTECQKGGVIQMTSKMLSLQSEEME